MAAGRAALIVAADRFDDARLAELRAPGNDAAELAAVLRDPLIGDFDVRVSRNQHHYEVRIALEDFFAERHLDDVLLLHFSCHGIKDEAGRLFFAVADTQRNRLNSTAIAADYVNELVNRTRSRRVVLFLDRCFSGAFTRGMFARGDASLDASERFRGRGRAVLTASSALEYAWEGDSLSRLGEPSIFTSAVVQGLRTGEADRDGDQQVSVDELYEYVFDDVRRRTPNQTPTKWSNVEGALIVAHSARSSSAAFVQPRVFSAVDASREADVGLSADSHGLAPVASPAASEAANQAWRPAGVVGGGWIIAWFASLALAGSPGLNDLAASVFVGLVAWIVAGPLIGTALGWAAPELPVRSVLLVGVGWPACVVVGVVSPTVLHMGGWGTAILGVSIGVAGALSALALAPIGGSIPWDRVTVVTAAWLAGWIWFGVTTWPEVFTRAASGSATSYNEIVSYVPLAKFAAGAVVSGLSGAVATYLLLLRPARNRPAPAAR
jgi:hypothetical protein